VNILICDDRQDEANELDRLLKNANSKIYTSVFNNGYDALEFAFSGSKIDVCILDIVMPEMDGIRLAKEMRRGGFRGAIVFLSSSREFAPESYEVKEFSYLLKPPTKESVKNLLDQLEKTQQTEDSAKILLKTPGIASSVFLRDISFIEVIQHKVYFRLCDGKEIVVNAAFKNFADTLLCDTRFIQCHRSYIVNMNEIAEISEWELKMRRGERIAITRTFHDARSKYYRWVFGDERR
jgi:DNA-binding LytR/AlgR family response regulator